MASASASKGATTILVVACIAILLMLREQETMNHLFAIHTPQPRKLHLNVPMATEHSIQVQMLHTPAEALYCHQEDEKDYEPTIIVERPLLFPSHPYAGCFVSCIFGVATNTIDKPPNVTKLYDTYPGYAFFMFTNLVELSAVGWNKVYYFDVRHRRFVTQSRYGKFVAWKNEFLRENCPVIYYLDGGYVPSASLDAFANRTRHIRSHPSGISQGRRPGVNITIWKEFQAIRNLGKDTNANIKATKQWLRAQPDFDENCQMYSNAVFGYDPKNLHYQQMSSFFWEQYSKEQMSWRDQPLWCYVVQRFGIPPNVYRIKNEMSVRKVKPSGKRRHKYGKETERGAQLFWDQMRQSACNDSTINALERIGHGETNAPEIV